MTRTESEHAHTHTQVEEERAKRADAERRLALVTLPPHTPLTAAAAAGDKQGWSGIDEGERQQGSGNQVGGILLGADLGLGAFREMCDRLENEKTEAVQRLDEAQQCLVTAQGQLARRNKEVFLYLSLGNHPPTTTNPSINSDVFIRARI